VNRGLGLALAACACTASQARVAHRSGEIAAGGGLIGLIATVGAAELVPDHSGQILRGGLVLVPVVVIGALVYAATDGMLENAEGPPPAHGRSWNAAYDLAREAKHAARRGDCAEVLAIQPRVRDLDADVYRRFLNDTIIRRCLLTPAATEAPAARAAPGDLVGPVRAVDVLAPPAAPAHGVADD